MSRSLTCEWNVQLQEDKEFPGYISVHVDPRSIKLYLKDGTQNGISIASISQKELCQIQFMINQALNMIEDAP